jgi:hypothetical protein
MVKLKGPFFLQVDFSNPKCYRRQLVTLFVETSGGDA